MLFTTSWNIFTVIVLPTTCVNFWICSQVVVIFSDVSWSTPVIEFWFNAEEFVKNCLTILFPDRSYLNSSPSTVLKSFFHKRFSKKLNQETTETKLKSFSNKNKFKSGSFFEKIQAFKCNLSKRQFHMYKLQFLSAVVRCQRVCNWGEFSM